MNKFFFCLGFLALVGCTAVNHFDGSGPIKLSPYVQENFEKYKNLAQPEFFAVSADGYFSYHSFCKVEGSCRDWEHGIRIALIGCERRADTPCNIYARGKDIVWK